MTVTLSGVPSRLVGSDWTSAQRQRLIGLALRAAETAAPRVSDSVLGVVTVTAADIEHELGLSDGDLDGGEVAPDQVLGFRPFADWSDGRTAVAGLYLAGPSAAPSPFLLGVSALRTANAVLADFKAGKLA
jgi:phytoene dehydrogenase-like protein